MAKSGASEEIRRCERVIRIFPNRESTMRLLGALLMEQDEQWSTDKRYRDMTIYWQRCFAHSAASAAAGGASQTV
jgi:putative transposase